MNEFESHDSSTFAMCVYYLTIGKHSGVANFINLSMYTRSKEARKTYMNFIALELGELINSLSFILTGIGRWESLKGGEFHTPITVHGCFYGKYWPHSQILGTEIPTLFLILTSIERIVAVCWPALFTIIFSERRRKMMMMVCSLLAALSFAAAAYSTSGNQRVHDDRHCGIIYSTAKWYSTVHFIFIVVGYGASLLSLVVMKIYRMNVGDAHNKSHRRDSKTNILIAFTAASLLLVAAPSLVMIGMGWKLFTLDDKAVALAYSATALVSIANMVINVVFRDDFRHAFSHWTNCIGASKHKEEAVAHVHHAASVPHQ